MRKYESSTGSSARLVRMMATIPRLAVMAVSRMTCTSMNEMAMKPTESEASATAPGSSRRRKLARAASRPAAPATISARTALTICTPWLTPTANTRNGTRMDMGSMPKPRAVTVPSCHTTATSEHTSGGRVRRTDRV